MSAGAARRLWILQPGQKLATLDAVRGDFSDWMLAGMGWPGGRASRLAPQRGDALPDPNAVDAVLITGSGAMVTDAEPWMLETAAWLRELHRLSRPILGICFGHQLLAQALGGEVQDNPRGVEVGTVDTRLSPAAGSDLLFAGLPPVCPVQASHRQSVTRLPAGAVRLSASTRDPNHAFRVGGQTWGVQFHPEFDDRIVRAYIAWYDGALEAQGDAPGQLLAAVMPTPQAAGVLRAFSAVVDG